MNAKRFLALALAMVMVFALFAGCTKTENNGGDNTNNGGNTDKPTNGKERTDIVIGSSADIVSPDPQNQNDTTSARVIRMIYDSLVTMDANNEFQPALAESWEQPSDTEYVFNLRKGVKFHNGDEMKASDVKFSYERCMNGTKTKQATDAIDKVEVVDDYTVKITTKYPYAPFFVNIAASSKTAIVSEKYVTEKGDNFAKEPMGTGPMKFKSWSPNNEFVVERNEEYWKGPQKTSSITIRVIPEVTSLTIALENGEIDIVESVIAVDAKRIKENPNLKTVEQVQGAVTYLGMNYLQKPFDDLRVRKAIAYAIDRQAIIDVVLEGYGEILNSVLPPMMPGFDPNVQGYDYDLDKAKALLAEAGYADGVGLTLELATSGDERNRIAQLIQNDLAKIGITVDINLLEWSAYLEYVGGKEHKMWILGWSNAYDADGTMFDVFHKDRPSVTNRSNYKNDEVTTLIEQARQELDWTKREQMYKDLQAMIMAEPVWVPLFAKTAVIGMNKGLEGVTFEPINDYSYVNAYVVE